MSKRHDKHAKPHGRTLFTADPHFGHANIIKTCNRPFSSVGEMDRFMIDAWNSVVAPKDTIYVVGDFAHWRLKGPQIREYFDALNGDKCLVIGNHDHEATIDLPWASKDHRAFLKIDGISIVLDHYAGKTWNKSFHGAIQLFGHSHNQMPGNSQQLDVGVDAWGYMPVSFPEIQARLATLPPFWSPPEVTEDADKDDRYGR
ncbi:metallophosphoesterase [Devosia sp. MC521]|uniref:metallophosphoesterase n=1 Tax=Devosia sp. MC521 TaxID=2759954 RepID=UPI0015FCD57E|nr:metallophosphoesterase [Devosia sp. MC521]MBJ6986044.1 metallophosphoesterase [Devosia sp. MC521]QMW61414.1 metallophosphoesterase [Devosia sp. MC521]